MPEIRFSLNMLCFSGHRMPGMFLINDVTMNEKVSEGLTYDGS